MSEILLNIDNVSKKYCRRLKRSLWYGVKDLFAELLLTGRKKKLRPFEFLSLDDVSFTLKRGEIIGIIGRNGAGKTTLLRLINGLIKPDSGKITVNGKIAALIALGTGFNPILTGRENIYVSAAILGLTKKEIDQKLDEIIDFAELGDFIESPVQTYSSGMQVRLGFSVAIHILPDIFLIDEVLSVGDYSFNRKCLSKINEITNSNNVGFIFVSHQLYTIEQLCDKVIWIESGVVQNIGRPSDIISQYQNYIFSLNTASSSEGDASSKLINKYSHFGPHVYFDSEKWISIYNAGFNDLVNQSIYTFTPKERVTLRFEYLLEKNIRSPYFIIRLLREDGLNVWYYKFGDSENIIQNKKSTIEVMIDGLQLISGTYLMSIRMFEGNQGIGCSLPIELNIKGESKIASESSLHNYSVYQPNAVVHYI